MMKKIWWTWDIRMRWRHGFCQTAESYLRNYKALIDSAPRYGVESVVIWGFLRDSHGGIRTAHELMDYAEKHSVEIWPGVGIDSYGGVYYDGESPYSLNCFLRDHPQYCARKENGDPVTYSWPATDPKKRFNMCPSVEEGIAYYQESLRWLTGEFGVRGIQIEQGDNGLCHCERCRNRKRTISGESGAAAEASASDAAARIPPVLRDVRKYVPDLTVLWETYSGLTAKQIEKFQPLLRHFPEDLHVSWQLYDGPAWGEPGVLKLEENVRSPSLHGCAAIRTNNDVFQGETDDREAIRNALRLSRKAGLDATYLYGEYPDTWPVTAANYRAWAESASGENGTF